MKPKFNLKIEGIFINKTFCRGHLKQYRQPDFKKNFAVPKRDLQDTLLRYCVHAINTELCLLLIIVSKPLSANTNKIFNKFPTFHSNILSRYCRLVVRDNLTLA